MKLSINDEGWYRPNVRGRWWVLINVFCVWYMVG